MKEHICEAAWSIARKFEPTDSARCKELAAAIHGAVLNENRRCINMIRDTQRLSTGMGKRDDGTGAMVNETEEMCASLAESMERSFSYR